MSGSFVLFSRPSVMAAIAIAAGCIPNTDDEYSSDCPECSHWKAWTTHAFESDGVTSYLVCTEDAVTPHPHVVGSHAGDPSGERAHATTTEGFTAIVRPGDGRLVDLTSGSNVVLGTNGGGALTDVNEDGQPDFWLSRVTARETSSNSELAYGVYVSPDYELALEIPMENAWRYYDGTQVVGAPFGSDGTRFVRLHSGRGAELLRLPTLEVVGSQDMKRSGCVIDAELALGPSESLICCRVGLGWRWDVVLLSGSTLQNRIEIAPPDPSEDVFALHVGLALENGRPVLATSSRENGIWTVRLWDARTGEPMREHQLEQEFQLLSMLLLQDPSGRERFDIGLRGVVGKLTTGRPVFRSLEGATGEVVFSLEPPFPGQVHTGVDVDADGHTDLAVLNRESETLEEYSGRDGTLLRSTDLSALPWPH